MKISGFTFMRNTCSLYYPFIESIKSILPLVDEFVIALGDNDTHDRTETMVKDIKSDKIKIIHTRWDVKTYLHGTIYAHQTDLAKKVCHGDWLFYLQSDEVMHEKYLDTVYDTCKKWNDDLNVEGFLFHYTHFWGDYAHYIKSHAWYPYEIRIIRNLPEIHSYSDAQSFKFIKDFDGVNYRTRDQVRRLRVRQLDAFIYHYGWVRPPSIMQSKNKVMAGYYHDKTKTESMHGNSAHHFDYGNMNHYPLFKETHPSVMNDFIEKFNWQKDLHYEKNYKPFRAALKHEKWKYLALSLMEQYLCNGRQLFGYKNWKLIN